MSAGIPLPEIPGVPFDAVVQDILGRPNFSCIGIANALRKKGHDIAPKSEAEQAAVVYWMLGLYLANPTGWLDDGDAYLKPTPPTVTK